MAKDLPPGTILSDEPFKADIGGGIEGTRPTGRMPTANETRDLMTELEHKVHTQQRESAQDAAREKLVAKLAVNAASVDFNPKYFGEADLQLFAKLVAAKNPPEFGILGAKEAENLVIEELQKAHQAKLIEAARRFSSPIISEDGLSPAERNIIESTAAAKPAKQATTKPFSDGHSGQGKGRDKIGKWTEQNAEKPAHTFSKLR